MKRFPRWLGFVILLHVPLWAQERPAATPPVMTLKSRADLVLVPAIVTGDSGQHIRGLRKADFIVIEDGKQQRVALFEEVTTTDKPARRQPDSNNEFSNHMVADKQPGRLTILLLDVLNTSWENEIYARDRLWKYLATIAETREPTALMVLYAGGIRVIHDFSTEPAVLAAALKTVRTHAPTGASDGESSATTGTAVPSARQKPEVSQGPTGSLRQEVERLQALKSESFGHFESIEFCQRVRTTLGALQALVQAYSGIPGRKALVWVTDVPLVPRSDCASQQLYARTLQSLADAQIAVYPVSAEGLVAPTGGGAANWNSHLDHWDRQYGPMSDVAGYTGGKAFYGRNDLENEFREAAEDSVQYYLLGYYLKGSAVPGWRRLEVKVRGNERQKLRVRARSGFSVLPQGADAKAELENDFALAATSPFDFTALPFKLRLTGTQPTTEGKLRLAFRISVPAGAFTIDESDRRYMRLDIGVVGIRADGDRSARASRKVEAHLTEKTLRALRSQGLTYDSEIDLVPGDYTLRVVVRDGLTGKMGTISAPYKVTN